MQETEERIQEVTVWFSEPQPERGLPEEKEQDGNPDRLPAAFVIRILLFGSTAQ